MSALDDDLRAARVAWAEVGRAVREALPPTRTLVIAWLVLAVVCTTIELAL